MIKFLQDSYNGIYKVLLKPYMPTAKTLLVLVGGFLLGLIVAYGVFPTVYYDADPSTLQQSWQDEWVKMLADRQAAANVDLSSLIITLLSRVDDPLGVVDRLRTSTIDPEEAARLDAIRPLAEQAQANAVQPPQPNAVDSLLPWILGPILLVVIGTIVAIIYGMFIHPNLVEPLLKRLRGEKISAEGQAVRQQVAATRAAEATLRTDFSTTALGAPIFQKMSSYAMGMGQYDYSYSIENDAGAFLGECGVSSSETIGIGEPQRVTAAEVWLFDKEDFQKTITKVFVSQHAFNDPALRARLEPKGELVVAQVGAITVLETSTIRLQARIVEVEYGTAGQLPPNSYFQKITVELAAWRKDGSSGATIQAMPPQQVNVPVTPPPMQSAPYNPPTMTPPMPPPQQVPGQSGGYVPAPRPAAPPPMQSPPAQPQRPRSDDDPFGGTGDFTPVG
jgi:hypothetical protein